MRIAERRQQLTDAFEPQAPRTAGAGEESGERGVVCRQFSCACPAAAGRPVM